MSIEAGKNPRNGSPGASAPNRRRFLLGASAAAGALAGGGVLTAPSAGVARAAVGHEGAAGRVVALTHATVIDMTGARPRPDTTVIVTGDRITRIGRSGELPIPPGARVLDLTGRFLIPGLCDMHVHSDLVDVDLPLYLANGVTTVREMWGHPYLHEWRDAIENGTLLGPRSVIASPLVDGSPELWNDNAPRPSAPIVVTDEAGARRVVREVKRDGADLVKVYSRLSRAAFHGLADEARRQRIPFAGHCPDLVPVEDAADAGMRSFEHLDGVWWSTSGRQAEIERALAAMTIDPDDAYGSWFRQVGALEWEAATSYHPGKAGALFARLRHGRSWQVPTLTMLQRLDLPGGAGDPRLKYVPTEIVQFWGQWADARRSERTPAQVAQHRELFERRLRLVGALDAAGVPILAGTDTGTTYVYPGFSLHDELDLLVQAGLTPMRALQAATMQPARYLGREDSTGTIERGKAADLVVLDANPLADIRNTQRIHAVLTRGRLITTAEREQMLADAAQAANPPGAARAAAARPAARRCGCLRHGI
jgi:imidazolonepropionase-like amidohydrolase